MRVLMPHPPSPVLHGLAWEWTTSSEVRNLKCNHGWYDWNSDFLHRKLAISTQELRCFMFYTQVCCRTELLHFFPNIQTSTENKCVLYIQHKQRFLWHGRHQWKLAALEPVNFYNTFHCIRDMFLEKYSDTFRQIRKYFLDFPLREGEV
jgi:hypothetical protein